MNPMYNDIGSTLKKRLANVKGRISTQFMNGDLQKSDSLSHKKKVEESVKMGGYEVSFRKPKTIRRETQQPMTGHSEFWLG